MNKLILALLINISVASAQTYNVKGSADADQTLALQNAFNDPSYYTFVFTGRVVLNGTVTVPEGKVIRFEAGSRLTGKGTMSGGHLEANPNIHIFDTSINVNPTSVLQSFSVKWFGAQEGIDAYASIQKSINTCLKNNIRTVYLPVGRYHISQPLVVRGTEQPGPDGAAIRNFCTLEILGESTFWDSNLGSEIYTDFENTFAIGIQNGKGCKVRKLKIVGRFKPPFQNDRGKYFNSTFDEFTDGKCRDKRYSPYAAIVIDPFTNLRSDALPSDGGYPGLTSYYGKANTFSTQTGSTATQIEEISINGFVVGICSSPNGLTRNAEISIMDKIQFENCKLAISGGQDQEKGNIVSNIHCWGGTHTIFATALYGSERQAGNWNIRHANLAGAVVRFIYNDQHGYFPTYISNIFAESLGTWGTINSELACEIYDCHVDFEYQKVAGPRTLLVSWGENIVYRNCNFRYYGETTPLEIEGNAVFDHCYFSGKPVKKVSTQVFGVVSRTKNKGLFAVVGLVVIALLSALAFSRSKQKRQQIHAYN
jgi:hypothetical protein